MHKSKYQLVGTFEAIGKYLLVISFLRLESLQFTYYHEIVKYKTYAHPLWLYVSLE